jgi:hypothetical protein
MLKEENQRLASPGTILKTGLVFWLMAFTLMGGLQTANEIVHFSPELASKPTTLHIDRQTFDQFLQDMPRKIDSLNDLAPQVMHSLAQMELTPRSMHRVAELIPPKHWDAILINQKKDQ